MATKNSIILRVKSSYEDELSVDAWQMVQQLRTRFGTEAEVTRKFVFAAHGINANAITDLDTQDGSFLVDDGILKVARTAVCQILDAVEKKHCASPYTDKIAVSKLLFRCFVLHEIRHRSQGLETYSSVQILKSAGGRQAMMEMDVIADRDAAYLLAILQAPADRRAHLAAFRNAIALTQEYFFDAFYPSPRRDDKVSRAVSILMMAARLVDLDAAVNLYEQSELPLDAPLIAFVSASNRSLSIVRGEPSKSVIG